MEKLTRKSLNIKGSEFKTILFTFNNTVITIKSGRELQL